ncbi:phosphotransferase RcsD, partial [Providencia hangzhouensis]
MYKQSLLKPNTLFRIFAAFILLLIVMLCLSLFNYYQALVQSRQASLNSMASRLAYQIEDYRYQASHIYKIANNKSSTPSADQLAVTGIRHDIFWLSSANQSIDAIVFGNNKQSSNVLASKLANYMEIVWGARNEYNSMYYLNGLDNTLVLVTTHSILKPELRFKESYLTLTAEEKRADMLTQSTLLDRREIISNIQKYSPDNLFYYTYRLMFNSPGQLTSVISFDISINSLIPPNLNGDFFTINTRPASTGSNEPHTTWVGTNLIFSHPIDGTSYQLYYHVSLKSIIFNVIGYNLWLMTGMLIMIFFALLIMLFIRKRLISPNTNML